MTMLPHPSLHKLQALNFMMAHGGPQYDVQIATKADKTEKQKGAGNDQQNEV